MYRKTIKCGIDFEDILDKTFDNFLTNAINVNLEYDKQNKDNKVLINNLNLEINKLIIKNDKLEGKIKKLNNKFKLNKSIKSQSQINYDKKNDILINNENICQISNNNINNENNNVKKNKKTKKTKTITITIFIKFWMNSIKILNQKNEENQEFTIKPNKIEITKDKLDNKNEDLNNKNCLDNNEIDCDDDDVELFDNEKYYFDLCEKNMNINILVIMK